jgi:hypothetical protein
MKTLFVTLITAGALAVPLGIARGQHGQDQKIEHKSTHPMTSSMSTGECRGFVVLPNGYAALSGITDQPGKSGDSHTAHASKQTMAHGNMKDSKSGHEKPMAQMGNDHLMGLKHGDNIKVESSRLCVPVNAKATTQWTAVSSDSSLNVSAKSLRGNLAHNSRANVGFELTIAEGSKPLGNAEVRVVARMPHHDKKMAGGHGPANDPDARGMTTKGAEKGRYVLNNVDFNMGGPWLFEVQVKRGSETSKAYFAATVGQE